MTSPKSTGQMIPKAYIDELRRRVEDGPGMSAVARKAGLGRTTVWRMLTGGKSEPRPVTIDAVNRISEALAALEPAQTLPPPVVGVRSPAHHAWIELADALTSADLAAVVAARPATLTALRKIAAAERGRARRK